MGASEDRRPDNEVNECARNIEVSLSRTLVRGSVGTVEDFQGHVHGNTRKTGQVGPDLALDVACQLTPPLPDLSLPY